MCYFSKLKHTAQHKAKNNEPKQSKFVTPPPPFHLERSFTAYTCRIQTSQTLPPLTKKLTHPKLSESAHHVWGGPKLQALVYDTLPSTDSCVEIKSAPSAA